MFVCVCNAVTDRDIVQAVSLGAQTLDDLKTELSVASCCGRCVDCACEVLDASLRGAAIPAC